MLLSENFSCPIRSGTIAFQTLYANTDLNPFELAENCPIQTPTVDPSLQEHEWRENLRNSSEGQHFPYGEAIGRILNFDDRNTIGPGVCSW